MLGDNIKELMTTNKITSKELSSIVGVTPTHISYILNNRRDPSIELLNKISNALGVSVNDLFETKDHSKTNNMLTYKKNIDIEKQKQIDTVAAHLEDKNLTPKKVKLLNDYIDALFDDDDW